MLPLDVANNGGEGGFPMETMWLVVYIAIGIFSIIIIPFAMFFYESEEAEGGGNQMAGAIKGTVAILLVFAVITGVLYILIGVAEIPTILISNVLTDSKPNDVAYDFTCAKYAAPADADAKNICTNFAEITMGSDKLINVEGKKANEFRDVNQFLVFRVSVVLFVITMVSFFGWLLFVIFGGIGLAALPFDMITSFKYRPQRIPYDKYLERRAKIGARATELVNIGTEIKGRSTGGIMGKKDRRNYNRFRAAIFLLEEDYDRLKISYERQGGKVILYYAMFFFGFIALGLSVAWVLQDVIYMWTQPQPFHPFLNNLVVSLDNAWGFLGTIVYGLFSFYLLFCVVKGNFKFGLRLFFLFPIHPMRITQFCTMAFSQYASATAINSLFSTAVRNIRILKWFWVVYVIAVFVMAILTSIFLFIKPKDKPAQFKMK
eukprot:gene3939-4560_t